jgi:hypothetical protein
MVALVVTQILALVRRRDRARNVASAFVFELRAYETRVKWYRHAAEQFREFVQASDLNNRLYEALLRIWPRWGQHRFSRCGRPTSNWQTWNYLRNSFNNPPAERGRGPDAEARVAADHREEVGTAFTAALVAAEQMIPTQSLL